MDDEFEEYERVLTTVPTVFVFKVPPRNATYGYRAKEFGVKENQVWVGKLQVVSKGKLASVKLIAPSDGKVFAVCPVRGEVEQSVEKASDSSRYFILRIEHASTGKHAFIGIGFDTRDEAFDFNVALQDHVKSIKAEEEPAKVSDAPALNLALKEGEKLKINVKVGGSKKKKKAAAEGDDDIGLEAPADKPARKSKKKAEDPLDMGSVGKALPPSGGGSDSWVTF